MDDYGRNQAFGGGLLQAYRDDTDRRGIYTLGNGATIEGRVDWFIRSSGIVYQDSADTYRLTPSNGYIGVTVNLFENDKNGTLSVNDIISLNSPGETKSFFLYPSSEYQSIRVADKFGSPINHTFGYSISVTHYGIPSGSFINNSVNTIYEGDTVSFLLGTQNIPAGTELYYSVSRGDSSRFYGGLSGRTIVGDNNSALISLTTVDNNLVNSDEVFTLTLFGNLASTIFTLKDKVTQQNYSFQSFQAFMSEGVSNGMIVQTTGVPSGTILNYSISGIAADRLNSGSLFGTATVDNNGQTRINLDIKANNRTDGPSTATVMIGNNLAAASVQINDTSLTETQNPAVIPIQNASPSYSIAGYSTSMSEGSSIQLMVQTNNVEIGTVLDYSISGVSADRLDMLSTGTTVVGFAGQAFIQLNVKENNRTDGPSTAIVTIGNNLATASVVINDASLSPQKTDGVMYKNSPYYVTNEKSILGTEVIDKVILRNSASNYQVTVNGSQSILSDKSSPAEVVSLTNIERLKFSDTNLALDVGPTQNAGSVYMLYKATFNRPSDSGGMGYWIAQKDGGANIVTSIAQGFVNSAEFIAKYGTNPSNASYVNNLYQNVLGRAGEAGGVTYWIGEMDAGRVSKAQALVQFATLPEGAGIVAPLIANGIQYQEWL